MTIKIPFLQAGNIWSGSKTLAVFTNPTELAFKKGNLKHHYPIVWQGIEYVDVEAAYQKNKTQFDSGEKDRADFITELIEIKLRTYPFIYDTIAANGGIRWLQKCSHWTSAKNKHWEGNGIKSLFLRCLMCAFMEIQDEKIRNVQS